jgi:transcriptional regulator of acetoin/glycerol metabolism
VENFAGRPVAVSPDVLALFARHRWPGNFRQLTNVLRTASAMLDDDETTIDVRHLPHDFLDELEATRDDSASAAAAVREASGVSAAHGAVAADESAMSAPADSRVVAAHAGSAPGHVARLDDIASSAVAAALDAHHGNVSAAARALGVSRNTIYRRMAALSAAGRAGPPPAPASSGPASAPDD